jgi:putative tributyrin esterase
MSRFRTIELSDPKFESAHLRFITVKSTKLGMRGDICVFTPPALSSHQTQPVVILLHGVYGSAWSWTHSGGVHLAAMELIRNEEMPPMIIAMPSDGLWGDGSAYLPHGGSDFEKWITHDVVDVLKEKITGVNEASPLFIGGLSMGGFGAMRIGAKYGDRFKGISAHSSITNLEQMKLFVEEDIDQYRQADKTEEDVFETIKKNIRQLPPLRFDCGKDDLLIEQNRLLHQQLEKENIEHIYEEFAGAHEWTYWTEHVRASLKFFGSLSSDWCE